MTLADIVFDLHAIARALLAFEERYRLLSEPFFTWYQQGNEPEDDAWVLDFAEWAGWCKSRERLLTLYNRRLQELLTADSNDLNHLIQQTYQAVPA